MATRNKLNVDLNSLFVDMSGQFKGLNPNEPGQWPILPKLAAFAAVAAAVVVVGWFLLLSSTADELQAERDREPGLRKDYRAKLAQAVNLSELRKQKIQVQEYVTQLEKQLPGKAEMDALLSDINQAGLGRGLQFELFRPGQVAVRDYYAELSSAELAEREEFVVEGCYLMRDRFKQQEVWENLGLDVAACAKAVAESETFAMYQSLLFQRIVPCVKDIGLWGPKVQAAYEDMGVLDMAGIDLDALMKADEDRAELVDAEKREMAARQAEVDKVIALAD